MVARGGGRRGRGPPLHLRPEELRKRCWNMARRRCGSLLRVGSLGKAGFLLGRRGYGVLQLLNRHRASRQDMASIGTTEDGLMTSELLEMLFTGRTEEDLKKEGTAAANILGIQQVHGELQRLVWPGAEPARGREHNHDASSGSRTALARGRCCCAPREGPGAGARGRQPSEGTGSTSCSTVVGVRWKQRRPPLPPLEVRRGAAPWGRRREPAGGGVRGRGRPTAQRPPSGGRPRRRPRPSGSAGLRRRTAREAEAEWTGGAAEAEAEAAGGGRGWSGRRRAERDSSEDRLVTAEDRLEVPVRAVGGEGAGGR